MNPSTRSALLKADEIRRKLGINMFQPVNIFDVCQRLSIDVRFVDVSMEGLYASNGSNPTIIISALRPLPRRCFTCAHELGHHVFGHGNRFDSLKKITEQFSDDGEEILVDTFAGTLLMPTAAIQSQFVKRKWKIKTATPLQFYIVASAFGTGYSTLITQCMIKELITRTEASILLKVKPSSLLKALYPEVMKVSYFKIIDEHSNSSVIDLEISNFLIVPNTSIIEGGQLEKVKAIGVSNIFLAKVSGIARLTDTVCNLSAFIRIQRENYVGLAEYRHLEN